MKKPSSRKGRTKPRVYTPISAKPAACVEAVPAISRTPVSTGPMHGVQAKENVKPSSSAGTGPIVHLSRLKGRRRSVSRVPE